MSRSHHLPTARRPRQASAGGPRAVQPGSRITRSRTRVRVRRGNPVQGATRGLTFWTVRRQLDDLLPLSRRTFQILFTERQHDALVEQRLRVRGADLQRSLELRQRLIRLVAVVVAHAEIRAGVGVPRIELDSLLVPLDCIVPPLGVEIHIAELNRRVDVLRVALKNGVQRLYAPFIQLRGLLLRRAAGRWLSCSSSCRRCRTSAPSLLRADDPTQDDAEAD